MADKRIKDLTNTAAESDIASGNYFALDGSAGTKKLNSTTLLTKTAQNALAGNEAPAFDETIHYNIGDVVVHDGKTFSFVNNHNGVWDNDDVLPYEMDLKNPAERISKIGEKLETLSSTSFIGLVPDSTSGKFVSNTTTYNSFLFDVGEGKTFDINVDSAKLVYSVQLDKFPAVGVSFAELNRENNATTKHRYLVVCCLKTAGFCKITQKATGIFSDFNTFAGNDKKVLSTAEFLGLIANTTSGYFVNQYSTYRDFVFDVGVGVSVKTPTDSSYICAVQSDYIPEYGDTLFEVTTDTEFVTKKRYVIIHCDSVSNCSITCSLSGVNGKLFEHGKEIGEVPYDLENETFIDLVPDSTSGRFSSSVTTYNSFLFDVGEGKEYSVYVDGGGFVYSVQTDFIPAYYRKFTNLSRKNNGVMEHRYLTVCVKNTSTKCVLHIYASGLKKSKTKRIKALFIGNSVNQDHVMYAPWYLKKSYGDDIEFEIGNFYIASYTIKSYVQNCVNGTKKADIFSVAYGTDVWYNRTNEVLLKDAVSLNDWDIICVQGYYNNGVEGPEDMSYLADLVQFISDNAVKPFTLGFMMHQTYRTGVLADIIAGAKYSVENSSVRMLFPCGFATEFVKSLWEQSFLTSDTIHNQEGLPCILGGYVVGDVLARYVGLPSRVMGNKNRMTSEEHDALNIAGQNGTFQAGTEAQFDQAQIAACKAVNAGYGVLSSAQVEMIPQE